MRDRTPGLGALLTVVAVAAFAPVAARGDAAHEVRGVYAAAFDANTQAKLDALIADAEQHRFNAIFLQVRSRGDAFYQPNRDDDTYPNPEPRGQTYALSPSDLDTLQYVIDRAHERGIEVHAWVTVYPIWNRSAQPADPAHAWRAHPDWVTRDAAGQQMTATADSEGAYLDPGIPAVYDYLFNVFLDIVRNYDVDGLHLDYIRYHGTGWGYAPETTARFLDDTGIDVSTQAVFAEGAWNVYRRHQISSLVRRVTQRVRAEKPNVVVSAYLIGYTDSIPGKLQGYNWWSGHDAIDALCGGYYGASLSTAQSRYDRFQENNPGGLPMVMPLGAEAVAFGNTPAQVRRFVEEFRADARAPVGFAHFDVSGLQADGDALFRALSDPGYPYAAAADIPDVLRPGADREPPNPPADVDAAAVDDARIRILFDRPGPAAGDGDLPVQYRIYRADADPVPTRYENLRMVFHDAAGDRESFEWVDELPEAGANRYLVIAYDRWRNAAAASTVGAVAGGGVEYIIESRAGGLNHADYSETGTWYNSSAHSTASGLTPGIGSRFALPADANERGDRGRFRPDFSAAGVYEVFLTTYAYSSANALDATVRITASEGVTDLVRDITGAAFGDQWVSVGEYSFAAGDRGYVEVSNATQTNLGGGSDSRLNADAARFVRLGGVSAEWERPEIASAAPEPPTIVVDDRPYRLDYEDGDGWVDTEAWAGSYLNGGARYTSTHPTPSGACWVAELPVDGWYRVEGHVRGNDSFTTTATYRFRDSAGLQTVTTSQRNEGAASQGYWSIAIDGGVLRRFPAGPVYVVLSDDGPGNAPVVADGVRFVPAPVGGDRLGLF